MGLEHSPLIAVKNRPRHHLFGQLNHQLDEVSHGYVLDSNLLFPLSIEMLPHLYRQLAYPDGFALVITRQVSSWISK